jgi:nucleoside 2-deoxyribosyltransferase
MKVFIAYDMNGENNKELLDSLGLISDALHAAGVDSYSTHVQQDEAPSGSTMKQAFAKIDESDAVLAIVQTGERSEAAILEVGYAFGRKPIHIMTHPDVKLASFELADSVTEWNTTEELTKMIQERFTHAGA